MSPGPAPGAVLRVAFAVAASAEESLVAELWARGTLGCEVSELPGGRRRVDAYFAAGREEEWPDGSSVGGVDLLGTELVPARDWLATYRRTVRPLRIGRRLIVDPRDPGRLGAAPGVELRLRIPARIAFGTGSHESTRLVLDLLEAEDLAGRDVLDVGTGSGILALAALGLGARCAVAFDIDLAAAFEAAANRRLNALSIEVFAGSVAALARAASFDLVLVNIVPDLILGEMEALVGHLRPGGDLVLSGLLAAQRRWVVDRLRALGLRSVGTLSAADWVCVRARRAAV